MKKISIVCTLIALIFIVGLTGTAFAATATSSSANMCLINPVAITAIGDYIFVADNVDETNNQSVILCFDVTSNAPSYKYTFPIDKQIVNIANVNGDLCLIYQESVETYSVSTTLTLVPEKTYSIKNAVDLTYGKYTALGMSIQTAYYIGGEDENSQHLFFYNSYTESFRQADSFRTPNPTACVEYNNHIYFLFDNGKAKRFDCNEGELSSTDPFNQGVAYTPGFVPTGMVVYDIGNGNQLAMFNERSIYYMIQTSSSHYAVDQVLFDYSSYNIDAPRSIRDICFGSEKFFILNSANEIEIFLHDEEQGFVKEPVTIGTDTITQDALPQKFTSFTLVKSGGYPTNIIYKTTDKDTSVEDIKTEYYGEYIILGFDGDDELPYYYVLLGDKYGWVKKSDGVQTADADPKISIIKNPANPSAPNATFKAKFSSPGTVFIYDLPLSNSSYTTFEQTMDKQQDAKLLQLFTETTATGTVEWYFVEYGDGQHGFIQTGRVYKWYAAESEETTTVETSWVKINSSLFEAVKIYFTEEMRPIDAMYDENGDVIKLYSGAMVRPIETKGDATFIEVRDNDNKLLAAGWVKTDNLIHKNAITTNTIVGLSILAVAIAVTVSFAVVFVQRRKKKAKLADEPKDENADH